jgi:hypothetical protein
VGSIRRECLDHVIVLGERHLHRILKAYFAYITARERISRWARMRRSREPSSCRASGGSWHCLKSVVCTADTSAALPDLPPQTLPPSARKARSVQPAISACVPRRSAVPLRPRGAWKHRLCRPATVLGCPDKNLAKDSRLAATAT